MTYKPINNFMLYIVILLKKVFLVFKGVAKQNAFVLFTREKKFASESSVFDGKQPVEKKERKLFFVRCFFIRV